MKYLYKASAAASLLVLCFVISACAAKTPPSAASITLKDFSQATINKMGAEGRFTLLHFWSTWCKTCEHELITLENLNRSLSLSHIQIISVAIDSTEENTGKMIERHGLTFVTMLDRSDFAKNFYQINDVPQTFLLNRDGKLIPFIEPASGQAVYRTIGPQAWDRPAVVQFFRNFVDALEYGSQLGESPRS